METVTGRCDQILIEPRPDLAAARGATSAAWTDILADIDREVMTRGGYCKARGLGPASTLVPIDCRYNHIGADRPTLNELGEYLAAGGARPLGRAVRRLV